MHRAEAIMQSVKTILTGLATTETRVIRARVRTVDDHPSISIEMGSDDVDPEKSNITRMYRDINIKVTSYVKDNITYESDLNVIKSEVFAAMHAENALGLSFVSDVMLIGEEEPEFTGEADKITSKQTLNYVVTYTHPWDNAEV